MTGDENVLVSLPPAVLNHLRSAVGDAAVSNARIEEAKSAQQRVFIVSFDANQCHIHHDLSLQWRDALERGSYNIVVRLWIGSARWWNLHCSSLLNDEKQDDRTAGVLILARAEVAGYRIARTALAGALHHCHLDIPHVLHFSHDSKKCEEKQQPWALMSYVGPKSTFFNDSKHIIHTDEWLDGMIPIRHEWGFDEPHPRWGRVPVDKCLIYVIHILERFILPMHRYFLSNETCQLDWTGLGNQLLQGNVQPRRYKDMVELYERAHSKMIRELKGDDKDKQMKIVHVLGRCIAQLSQNNVVEDMPPVLCHMDCQPQNLVFFRHVQDGRFQLHSVLDWEEAAYADPRFEILLLCRKVCANRDQAQVVWDFYAKEIRRIHHPSVVGAIDPWLKLEIVHSITTLVLQSMDLQGGGRNPWETKPDVLGKIEREFHRLIGLGWTFCEDAVTR